VEAALQATVSKLKSTQAEHRAACMQWEEERRSFEHSASLSSERYTKELDVLKGSLDVANSTAVVGEWFHSHVPCVCVSEEIHDLTSALSATADELQGVKQKLRVVEGQCQAKDVTISTLNDGLAITAQETATLKAVIVDLNASHEQELASVKAAVGIVSISSLIYSHGVRWLLLPHTG
jgi:hypothetical protein